MNTEEQRAEAIQGMFKALEAMAEFASFATGVKQNFLDQGWSQEGAEMMAITIFQGVVAQQPPSKITEKMEEKLRRSGNAN